MIQWLDLFHYDCTGRLEKTNPQLPSLSPMTRALKHINPYRKPSAKGCSCTRSGARVSRTRGLPGLPDSTDCVARRPSISSPDLGMGREWFGAVQAHRPATWWRNFAPRTAPAVFVCDHHQVQCGTQLSTSFGLKIAFGKVGILPQHFFPSLTKRVPTRYQMPCSCHSRPAAEGPEEGPAESSSQYLYTLRPDKSWVVPRAQCVYWIPQQEKVPAKHRMKPKQPKKKHVPPERIGFFKETRAWDWSYVPQASPFQK